MPERFRNAWLPKGLTLIRADKNHNWLFDPLTATAWENVTLTGSGTIDWAKEFAVPKGARAVLVQVQGIAGAIVSPKVYAATASGGLTLSGSYQDIPGAAFTLVEAADYAIAASVDLRFATPVGGGLGYALAQLVVNSVAQTPDVDLGFDPGITVTLNGGSVGESVSIGGSVSLLANVGQIWLVTTASPNLVAKLQAKYAGAATSGYASTRQTIMAHQVSYPKAGALLQLSANSGASDYVTFVAPAPAQAHYQQLIVPVSAAGTSYFIFSATFASLYLRVRGWYV